jgi:hypothetical protein
MSTRFAYSFPVFLLCHSNDDTHTDIMEVTIEGYPAIVLFTDSYAAEQYRDEHNDSRSILELPTPQLLISLLKHQKKVRLVVMDPLRPTVRAAVFTKAAVLEGLKELAIPFPLWTLANGGKTVTIGLESYTDMPAIFTDRDGALIFLAETKLDAVPLEMAEPTRLVAMLEHYKARGSTFVAYDVWPKFGSSLVPIDEFIESARAV